MRNWDAGDRSYMLQYGYKDEAGTFRFYDPEFASEEKAMAEVKYLLGLGQVEQVSVIKWRHEHNLPGALPLIVAKSLSLTVYKLVDGEVAEKPVDIFSSCY